jgi:glutathione reductase (NADPH)
MPPDLGARRNTMHHNFDVLVIGTGTAGYTLAMACSKGGRRVAIVDNQPYGGTCAMRGCQPKKYLVDAAEVARLSRQMSEIGIHPAAQIDWPALMHSKSAFTDAVPERTERGLRKAGIELFNGTARFLSPEEVAVGEETTIRAQHIVIATGARPAPLNFPGAELVVTSDDFLELIKLPRRIVFIGGGYISLEFAHVARAAGAEVTILHRGERILKRFEAELVDRLSASAHAFGIKIITGINACSFEKLRGALVTYGAAGCTESFQSDLIVNGSGRLPDLDGLDLAAGGVERKPRGVAVNEFLQSVSNPRVYAIGDACDSPFQLATVADMQAEVAAENILKGNLRSPDYQGVPSVVFTQPPLAGVGMTEEQAGQAGEKFRVNHGSMAEWPSSRRIGQKHACYKVLIQEQTGLILGAHLFGHNAGEAINIFALAIKFGLTNLDLKKVLWAYPTHVSDLKYMIS